MNRSGKVKRKGLSLEKREALYGFLFISPWIIGGLLLLMFPIFRSLQLSVHNITNIADWELEWAGLEHFKKAIFGDAIYFEYYLDTVKSMMIQIPLINVFALTVAVFLNRRFAGRTMFRLLFFLPVLLGTGFIMQQLMGQKVDQETMEVARKVLLPQEVTIYLGPKITNWISEFLNVITTALWKSGVQIVIYLAGLQGVSRQLYEAARVDSATEWETFWLITLPMVTPMMQLNLIYSVVDSFSDESNSLLAYIVRQGFVANKFEYSSAMGWLFFVFAIILIVALFLITQRFVNRVKE